MGDKMKIQLTQNKQAIIDDEDYDRIKGYSWQAYKYRNRWYAKTTYSIGGRSRRTLYLHKLILFCPPGKNIYHIDGDGLNNCKYNLLVDNKGNKDRIITYPAY